MMKKIILILFALLSIIGSKSLLHAQETDSPLFVREDCVWEYYMDFQPPIPDRASQSLFRFRFTDEAVINNQKYSVLKEIYRVTWYPNGKYEQIEENSDEVIAYIREENGKVYMLNTFNEPLNKYLGNGQFGEDLPLQHEIQLYDYNTEEGKMFSALCCVGEYNNPQPEKFFLGDYIVKSIGNGKVVAEWAPQYYDEKINGGYENIFKYVIGVGNVGRGWITGPLIQDFSFANGSYCDMGFNNLYDLEGNVIFPGKGTIAGVSTVEADESRDERMYDVMGREIRNPQPGTIYIRNGRKYIAR